MSRVLRETFAERFQALSHRNFRLFWAGQLVSLIGTWMQSVGQGWLMHRLTGSAWMLGLLAFTQFLPVMALSLWAGVVADSTDKRRLILTTQSLALFQATSLAVVVGTGVVEPWMILALAFVFGSISAFDLPARQSFLVELVGGKEDLPNAIALNSMAFNVARVVGPAVAGVLVASVGEFACFTINAVSYLVVIAMLVRVRVASRRADSRGDTLCTLKEGIRYATGNRPIRNLLLLLGVTCGLGFQYMTLLPVYARQILQTGAREYGLLVSAFGLGSLASAIVLTRRQDRWALRRNLLAGLAIAAIAMAAFAWSRLLPLTLLMGFASGFGLILYVASTNMLLQLTVEDRFRGRVMSLYTFMFIGTAPIGALLSGWIAQQSSAPVATTVCAVVLAGGAVWVAYRLRVLAARETAERLATPVTAERVG